MRPKLLPILLVVGVLAAPTSATAESTPAADFTLDLATTHVATPTTARLHVVFKTPSDPSARPSPQRTVAIELPAG